MKRYLTKFSSADDGGGTGGAGTSADVADGAAKTAGDDKDKPADDKKDSDKPADSVPGGKYTEEDIAKLKADFDRKLTEAVSKAGEEALKKAQMKPEEKAEYERDQKQAELDRRDREAALRELRLDALDMLNEKQLDKGFLDFVIGADKEGTAKKIEALGAMFDKAVQARVEVRLAGKSPQAGDKPNGDDAVRNTFRNAMGGY